MPNCAFPRSASGCIPVSPAAACRSRSVTVPGWLASAAEGVRAVRRRSSRPPRTPPVRPDSSQSPLAVVPLADSLHPLFVDSRAFVPAFPPRVVRSLPRRLPGLHPFHPPERPALAGCSAAFRSRETPCYSPLRSFRPSTLAGLLCRLLTSAVGQVGLLLPQSGFPDGRQISRGKFDSLQRTTAGFTTSALMDLDFVVNGRLVRRRMPRIRFLSIGSRLCFTLPSDPASRRRPCASLGLHLHQVVQGTFTLKLPKHARHTIQKGGAVARLPLGR